MSGVDAEGDDPRTWMTVGRLRGELEGVDPAAWVCLNGFGPARRVWSELGASEPFIVIEGDA